MELERHRIAACYLDSWLPCRKDLLQAELHDYRITAHTGLPFEGGPVKEHRLTLNCLGNLIREAWFLLRFSSR